LGEKYYEKFMTETEAQIQKTIMQWGQYKKVLMHRIKNNFKLLILLLNKTSKPLTYCNH